MKPVILLAGLGVMFGAGAAHAIEPLRVEVDRLSSGDPISETYALCEASPEGKSTEGKNERPVISWSRPPKGTRSLAVIVSDPDVPQDFSKAGKEGMVVKKNAPRQLFFHWALVDIPATTTHIEGGDVGAPIGFGQPLANDLTGYMPDPTQYGGPCPPWNDERLHHYHFTVYALDIASLGLAKDATAKQAAAMLTTSKHVLAKGEIVGTYTLNNELRKPHK